MAATYKLLVLLLSMTGALLLWNQALMEPSCAPTAEALHSSASSPLLRVVVVADLHLAGPGTAWVDRVRRESFMRSIFQGSPLLELFVGGASCTSQQQLHIPCSAKLFHNFPTYVANLAEDWTMYLQKTYRRLNPDALVVLGDVSDAGRKSNDVQWKAVVARFWDLVHPFTAVGKPIQVVVGNHDVGDHHDPGFSSRLPRFAASFPGLDDTCDSHFNWNAINFVSLNAMALHGDGCSVCSRVENNVESIRSALERHHKESDHGQDIHSHRIGGADRGGSAGPVVLLHLPLHRADDNACTHIDLPRCAPWHDLEGSCMKVGSAPPLVLPQEELYRVGQDVLSYKSSTQILQSFRPRLVLSGHTHRWCDRVHADGTREVTVPSLSWRNRDDPSFALVTFHANSSYTIHRCMLARESTVILLYVLWGFTMTSWVLAAAFIVVHRLRSKSVKPE